jgi:hypothetical protein
MCRTLVIKKEQFPPMKRAIGRLPPNLRIKINPVNNVTRLIASQISRGQLQITRAVLGQFHLYDYRTGIALRNPGCVSGNQRLAAVRINITEWVQGVASKLFRKGQQFACIS